MEVTMKKKVLGLALVAVIAALLAATASAQDCDPEQRPPTAECFVLQREDVDSVFYGCAISENRLEGCPAVDTTCAPLCNLEDREEVFAEQTNFCKDCGDESKGVPFEITLDQYCKEPDDDGIIPQETLEFQAACQLLYFDNYYYVTRDLANRESEDESDPPTNRENGDSEAVSDESDSSTIHFDGRPGNSGDGGESESDDSATKPIVTLFGPQTLLFEQTENAFVYIDEFGATAFDEIDGRIDELITLEGDVVDTSVAGEYVLRYNVINSRGQEGFAIRTVVIVPSNVPLPPSGSNQTTGEDSESVEPCPEGLRLVGDVCVCREENSTLDRTTGSCVPTDSDSEDSDGSDSNSGSEDSDGSDSDSDSEDDPGVCCQALTAECEACKAGVSVRKYCKKNPDTDGCPEPKEPEDPKEWKSYVHASTSGEAEADSRGKRRGHVVAESSESVRARKKRGQRYSVHALSDTNSTVTAKGENAKGKASAKAKANVDDWWRSQADSKSETSAEVTIKDGEVDGKVSEHLDANSNGKYAWGEAKGKADAKGYGYIWKKNNAGPTPTEDKWKKPHKKWGRKRPSHKKWRKWGHKKNE